MVRVVQSARVRANDFSCLLHRTVLHLYWKKDGPAVQVPHNAG